MFSEKTVHQKTIYQGRVFQVEEQTVQLHDGQFARREIVRHNGGACVIAMDAHEHVYLVRQFRKPFDRMLLEVPAGKLEVNEDPLECARRELIEETGLRAEKIEWLATVYPTPGYCSEILTVYLATALEQGQANLDEGEHLTCHRYPLCELLDMVDRGEIKDAKTQIALLAVYRRLQKDKCHEEADQP